MSILVTTCGSSTSCAEILLRLLGIGLSNGAIIALNAIGVTLIYGVVRTLNFAHGDLFALTTVLITSFITTLGLNQRSGLLALGGGLALALVVAVLAAGMVNVVVERAAFQPFIGRSPLAPLIATIGISFMLYQAALLWRQASYIVGEHRSVPGLPETPRGSIPRLLPQTDLGAQLGLGVRYTVADLLVLLLALSCAAGVSLLLRRTRIGQALRACAQDPTMAALCGISQRRIFQVAFALGGALAGIAAFTFAVYYGNPYSNHGLQSGLIAFVAAVLGGVGRPWGALLAGLLLGVLAALSDYFLAAQWTPALLLGLLIALLLVRPQGLTGGGSALADSSGELGAAPLRRGGGWRWALVAGGLLLYPAIDSLLGLRLPLVATGMLISGLLALGLTLILGRAGLLDLGYAAFFGIGGYTAALLTVPGGRFAIPGLDLSVVIAASAGAAALLGLLSSLLTIRLRGDELAISTLALGQIVTAIWFNFDTLTGGDRGMTALPPPVIAGLKISAPWGIYALVLVMLGLTTLLSYRLTHSRLGRGWTALAQDELAAWSCGISPLRSRVQVFVLGSAIAGMAGALSATAFRYIDPSQSELRLSAMVLAMVVIGGAGSLSGAIVGAVIIASIDQLLIPRLGALLDQLRPPDAEGLLTLLDVRGLSFLSFGLALYLTVWLRARRNTPA